MAYTDSSIEIPSAQLAETGSPAAAIQPGAQSAEEARLHYDITKYYDNHERSCKISVEAHHFLSLESAHQAEILKHRAMYH